MSRGIDVSNNNGHINWDALASAPDVDFAIAKVSEGTFFTDSFFPENWANMRKAVEVRGAYHFARPSSTTDPKREADYFLSLLNHAGGLEPTDLVVLDMEDEKASGDVSAWTLAWLQYVHDQVGFPPLLYTGPWYIDSWLRARDGMERYPLWLAAYGAAMPPCPSPWTTYLMWQYTSQGRLPGIGNDVDLDTVYNIDELKAHGKPSAVPPATPDAPTTDLATVVGYLTHDVADALSKEVATMRASLDAMEAAISTLRRAGAP